jgi:rRNA maturation RNase YbeY
MRPTLGYYQYMLGDDIFVAPMVSEGNDRTIVFPAGEWIYMFDESKIYKQGVRKLSFPLDELRAPADDEPPPRGMLGDILVCPTVAARQAARNGRSTRQEIEYLTVHGILHLLDYDHAEPAEHAVMFALNDRLIADWNASRR